MNRKYTGPVRPSNEDWEKWYHRMKDVLAAIHQRGYGVACSPKDEPMMRDMLARLVEDDTWQWGQNHPPLVVSRLAKQGELQPIDPATMQRLTMGEMMRSGKGFGRYKGLATPDRDEIIDPWKPPV